MAETTLKVRVDAAINAEPTLKALRELKKLQKETVAGSDDFKKIQSRINDIGDATKTAKGQSEDWIDALAGAGGPIGMLGRGLDTVTSSTNKFGLAIKATGIGLLVALVGQLVTAFTSNEKAMKKLEPVMIGFEKILGGIFAALEPVFDIFVEMVEWALPGLTKGIGILYSTLYGLFTMIKDIGVGAGKLLAGIFTLDADMIKEGMSQFTNSISNGIDSGLKTYERFEKGTKEITKTEKKNLEDRGKAHQEYLEKRKSQIEQEQKLSEANLSKQKAIALDAAKTEEERLAIEKKFAMDTFLSKKKALEETQKLYPKGSKEYKDYTTQLIALEGEYIAKKTEFRNKDLEIAKKLFDEEVKSTQQANKRKTDDLILNFNLQKELYGENSKEARKAQDEVLKSQMEGLKAEEALYLQKKELTKEETARLDEIVQAQKALTNTIQVETEKRKKVDLDIQLKASEQLKAERDKEFQRTFEANNLNLEEQARLLSEKKKLDEQYYADQLALIGLNDEQKAALNQKRLESEQFFIDQEGLLEQKRVQQKLTSLDNIIQIAGAESAVGRAALIAKQLLLAKELVIEAKRTIFGATQAAANGTVAVAEGAAKTARVGFPQNIPLLIAYAAQAAGIISTIAKAVSGAKQAASEAMSMGGETVATSSGVSVPKPRGLATGGLVSGPGGPKSDLIPAMLSNGESVINANSTKMFAPLLSRINEMGGGVGFAQGGLSVNSFTSSNNMNTNDLGQVLPIKTYVVSSDMSNQQMMDRAIKTRSTL